MTTRPSRPARLAAALASLAALTALVLTGCSGSDDADDGGGDSGAASASRAEAAAPADAEALAGTDDSTGDGDGADGGAGTRQTVAQEAALVDRHVIRTGAVELRAKDVDQAQHDVQRLADRHQAQVSDEETSSDDDGRAAYTRMVVRVPEKEFSALVADLKGVATLVSATTDEKDVTSKVIDLETRIAVQRRSIARITTLFERAEAIKDVMAIEAELSSRQADLDSLEQQSAYLAGRTTLSTVTVSIDRTAAPAAKHEQRDDDGFLAGLSAGWGALTTFGGGVATVAGALLPWAVLVALLTPPTLVVTRVVRRRVSASRSARTPSAA